MKPEFVRINQAIHYTLEFYEIGKIKTYMLRYASNSDTHWIDDWNEYVLKFHQRMEDEINQTIHTTNRNTQVFMFETLKDWLTDTRIKELNVGLIFQEIDKYNEREYAEFELRIEKKVEEFRSTPNFNSRKHLEEFEFEMKAGWLLGTPGLSFPYKTKSIHYSFYCITERPELLDIIHIKKYWRLVDSIIENFRRILMKYIKMYDEGKIVSSTDLIIGRNMIPIEESKKLLQAPKQNLKLKVNLSVAQLAYLFRLLYDFNLLDVSSKSEVKQFIVANFSTKGSEDISEKSIENKLSTTEKAEADFWANKFIELHNASKKV